MFFGNTNVERSRCKAFALCSQMVAQWSHFYYPLVNQNKYA